VKVVQFMSFQFSSIEDIDAGRYACTATNAGGTTEAVAEVIVNAPEATSLSPRRSTKSKPIMFNSLFKKKQKKMAKAKSLESFPSESGISPYSLFLYGPSPTCGSKAFVPKQRGRKGFFIISPTLW